MKPKFIEKMGANFKKLVGLSVWILIIILAVSIIRNIGKVGRIRREVQAERDRLAKLQKDNEMLQAEIAASQGSGFLEKEIRDKLGLAKEGEAVVVLPDTETLRKLAPPPVNEEDTLPDPNWKRWLKLFL